MRKAPIPEYRGGRRRLAGGIADTVTVVTVTMVAALAMAAPQVAQNPTTGAQNGPAGAQNPAAGPQNPPAGQGSGGAPRPDVRANQQAAPPVTPVSSGPASPTPVPSGTPTGTPIVAPGGARTAHPIKPRLRVEWRGGSLYVIAQREPLSAVLAEIARRTGVKVEGAEQLHELVSVELMKMPLEDSLERLLARDDYAIQKDPRPDGSVRLRVVILRGAPDGSGLTAAEPASAAPAPSTGGQPAAPAAASTQPPGGAPGPGSDGAPAEDEVAIKRLQKLQQLAKSDQDDRVVLPALAKALEDDDDGVRDFAIQSLAARATPEAIGYLRDVLHDPDPSTRLSVLESLGEKEEGRPILEEALSDTDDSVRSEAAALLKQIDTSTPK